MFEEIKTQGNNLMNRLHQALNAFHSEERGASGSVDNIMLIFVAAIILVALLALTNETVWTAVEQNVTDVMGTTIGG
jgi:hypothetical protein